MRQYYIQLANQQKGPYTLDQLRDIYFNKSTPIWYEGLQSWTTVQEVPEVNAILLTPPSFNNSAAKKTATPPPKQATVKSNLDKPPLFSEYPIEKKKRNYTVFFVLGLILLCVIAGLMYTNRSQSSELNKFSISQAQQSAAEIEKKKMEEALNAKNRNYRNNWKKFIAFGDVNPSFDDFGGCDPFAVPIKNNTDQLLDEVDVELKYIKADGDVYKVERVAITNIPPHEQKEGTGPSSPRGLSLEKQIVGVVSRGMHFCYPSNNGNADDPYLCN